jgi:hypothetical protein
MLHKHAAHALIALLEGGQTPSGPASVFQHAPATCTGMQRGATVRGQNMPLHRLVPVRQCRRERVRALDATARHHHDDLCPRAATEGQHVMAIGAPSLGLTMGNPLLEDFRRPIWDGPKPTEPHATRHAAPHADSAPRLGV